jgi:ornithine decarboxylase
VGDDRSVELAVRFVLPRDRAASAHDFSTKFGAPEHIAIELLQDIERRGYVPVMTFHPGSQSRDPAGLCAPHRGGRPHRARGRHPCRHAQCRRRLSRQLSLSKPAPLENFFTTIAEATTRHFGKGTEPELECEPGRGLVASSMSLLTRIKLVCSDGDDIFLNDGIYGGLMEFMQVPELQPPYRVIRDGKVVDGAHQAVEGLRPHLRSARRAAQHARPSPGHPGRGFHRVRHAGRLWHCHLHHVQRLWRATP